nr:uncharacterized protein LOC112547803 isoform X2 [Pelodiscus sinensis]|eukprot:XP_025046702.1 uncharacterized protein LOC112547803 isoform X2 [Pelodiscus sinensis]
MDFIPKRKGIFSIYCPVILSPMSVICSVLLPPCSSFAELSIWCSTAQPQDEGLLLTGTPLSELEYDQFFKPLRAPHRASAICLIRALYGCQNPLIQRLDQYENHGVIPQGARKDFEKDGRTPSERNRPAHISQSYCGRLYSSLFRGGGFWVIWEHSIEMNKLLHTTAIL